MSELNVEAKHLNSLIKRKGEQWEKFPPSTFGFGVVETLDKVQSFEVFDDDVYLIGFPRSGTTLTSEMIWLILNNFDFEKAKTLVTDDRIGGLEYDDTVQLLCKRNIMNTFATLPRPRTIRSHLPVQFLPDQIWKKKPKLIYISRDPRDVVVSYYHLCKHFNKTTLTEFLNSFMADNCVYGPYREHRLNYWNIPDYSNILYLTYESVTSNMDEAIQKVANFLNVEVSHENQQQLTEYLRFDKMKTNSACNHEQFIEAANKKFKQEESTDDFIRKGKIEGFRDELLAEVIEKLDKWIAEEDHIETGFAKKTR